MSVDPRSRDALVAEVATVLKSLSPADLRLRFGRAAGGADWLLADLRRDPEHHVYVAHEGDVPIAVLDTARDAGSVEFGLVVAPSHRRSGIARTMLEDMIEHEARERSGPLRFVGVCLPENRAAVALMRKAGFERAGRWQEYLRFERVA